MSVRATGIVAAVVLGLVAACSSVPDVRFADEGVDAASPRDGGADGRSADAAPPSCTGHSGKGVCCPNGVWCQNCIALDCSQCPVCSPDLVCCMNNGGKFACMGGQNC